jgi:hypothetical protein
MVSAFSAFAARHRLVLAQTKVSEKSNEIVAIPTLPDMMAIEGAVVTLGVRYRSAPKSACYKDL